MRFAFSTKRSDRFHAGSAPFIWCLAAMALAGSSLYPAARVVLAQAASGAAAPARENPEDMRTSQNTVLEPIAGQVGKFDPGAKAFLDGDELLGSMPIELQARSFIRSHKNGVKAICRQPGYVYAVADAKGEQIRVLRQRGFRQLDFTEFQIFANDETRKGLAFQKAVTAGEELEFGSWVLLVFGPEELGGVPYAKMRSLTPKVFLPDGSEFKTWEAEPQFSRTYYVEQSNAKAADNNPGTRDLPFKTISQAARVLQPGERVVVGAGVYREQVRPARGGTDPEHMIGYEAAPGAKVVIKGSEVLKVKWTESTPWVRDTRYDKRENVTSRVWMAKLPAELFQAYNPFAMANYSQMAQMPYWNIPELFSDPSFSGRAMGRLYLQVRGLIFQNGRRLRQVTKYTNLYDVEGAFWMETNGSTIHISTIDGADPNTADWEVTAREQIFAPEEYGLGYIRVKGFTMEHAANAFPFPQRGAISTMHGHHWLIENNTIQWVNAVAVDIGDQGEPPSRRQPVLGYHVLRGNTFLDIGIVGITGPGPFGTLIEDNIFRRIAWHDAEFLAECGAIKMHHNLRVLVRRNLIFDTRHGTGIYMDSNNSNSRITQNVVVATGTNLGPGPGTGGIYMEAARLPNMVDNNFVWGSTRTNGIYDYSSSKLIIANNLVGNCAAFGILVIDHSGRPSSNGIIPGGQNRIVNNILINNGWNMGVFSPNNESDHNVFANARHFRPFQDLRKQEELVLSEWRERRRFDLNSVDADISARFNPETLEFVWQARDAAVRSIRVEGVDGDFWSRSRADRPPFAGPFGAVPSETQRIVVDPRPHGK